MGAYLITLVTGGPGAGKTAWLVSQLIQMKVQQPHRRLLAHGIKEFKLSHEQIFCRNPNCEMCSDNDIFQQSLKYPESSKDLLFVEEWHQWKRPYDLIVIDEAQRAWKSKPGAVLDSIALLDTHRHSGIDFWLLTQSPKLLHVDVRVMVTRHIHLVSKWNGRKEYEWSEVSDNVQSTLSAVERSYSLPTHVYNFYKSAEIHTKQDKRKPITFYVMLAAIMFALVAISFTVIRIKKRVANRSEIDNVSETSLPAAGSGALAPDPAAGETVNGSEPITTKEQFFSAYTPVVPGVPWSAPVYKEMAKPRTMPILVGCILSKKTDNPRCNCYTQQGTVIDLDYASCAYQINHRSFNPFREENNDRKLLKNTSENQDILINKKSDL